MTTKSKRELSSQINRILKENQFYRLAGGWYASTLHIGIQPLGLFESGFNYEGTLKKYKKVLRQIKAIKNVKAAKSKDWYSGWSSCAGIEIIL